MIENQDLFQYIPKHIQQWSSKDVQKWFKINNIDIQQNIEINGKQFLNLTSSKLIKQFKLSNFLARKITDWIQFQVTDFQNYVNQNQQKKLLIENKNKEISNQKANNLKKQNNEEKHQNMCMQKIQKNKNNKIQEISKVFEQKKESKLLISLDDQNKQYKELKYQPVKNQSKKPNFFENNQNFSQFKQKLILKANKRINKNQLVLKQLTQNQQNSNDVQTCKYLPYDNEHIQNKQNQSQNKQLIQSNNSVDYFQHNVKFASSQFLLPQSNMLIAYFYQTFYQIQGFTTIGRSTKNHITLKSQGVSRNHAEILVQQVFENQSLQFQKNQNSSIKKYFLKDVGSKFGTFVNIDPQKPKKITQNDHFSIGQTIIKIKSLKIYKNKQKFDLTITLLLEEDQQKSFYNKSTVTIGNSNKKIYRQSSQNNGISNKYLSNQITKRSKQQNKRDLQLSEDQTIKSNHCRFILINGDIYFQQVQGTIFEKLQTNKKMEFQRHKYQVKFGDGNVTFIFDNSNKQINLDIIDQ